MIIDCVLQTSACLIFHAYLLFNLINKKYFNCGNYAYLNWLIFQHSLRMTNRFKIFNVIADLFFVVASQFNFFFPRKFQHKKLCNNMMENLLLYQVDRHCHTAEMSFSSRHSFFSLLCLFITDLINFTMQW